MKLGCFSLPQLLERGYDFDYPFSEFNNNILIVGSSGSGKSYLGKKIFDEVKPKLTFIYKEDGVYSDFVRVSDCRPDISVNPLEFINSFNDCLNISSTGFMASQIMPLLSSSVGSHKGVVNLIRGLKDDMRASEKVNNITYGIYNYILQLVSLYYPSPKNAFSSIPDGTVLSFDGMSDVEQVFFSDFILRSVYHNLHDDVILIDEIHRLKGLSDGILGRVVREVRSRGALVGITQSISDLSDDLVNNFGSIFQFHSFHFEDLEKLRHISVSLPDFVVLLKRGYFIELQEFNELRMKSFERAYRVVD